jgi:hypothetical protein
MFPDWLTWRFRKTLAYWISMMYLEGSLLFCIGAGFSFGSAYLERPLPEAVLRAVVLAPYVVGSVNFSLGAWAGMEELLRISSLSGTGRPRIFCFARARHWRLVARELTYEPLVAYLCYFVGAVLFNINCVAGFWSLSVTNQELLLWVPATLGSVLFVVAGAIECHRNDVGGALFCRSGRRPCSICTAAVIVSVLNLLGALLFLLAALAGTFLSGASHPGARLFFLHRRDDNFGAPPPPPTPLVDGEVAATATATAAAITVNLDAGLLEHWLIDGGYLLGSACFLVGSLFQLWMWKAEQYGLAMLPELNQPEGHAQPDEYVANQKLLQQYGCGQASSWQLPWLCLYLMNASASVIDVSLELQHTEASESAYTLTSGHRVAESVLDFTLSHGVVLLASVVHHVPKAAPHSWLLWYMRAVMLLYTINSWLTVHEFINRLCSASSPPPAPPPA